MVETTGRDGLLHHVGPFRYREEAEDWIAQNPPGPGPTDAPGATQFPRETNKRKWIAE
jgi:hypothetical protein